MAIAGAVASSMAMIAAMIAVIGLLLFLNLPIRFPSCVGWAYETAPAGMSGEG
ncbi:hypothetical protein [Bifidobacterium breve]|uniref:hypothetical protein n=1 Tax=Bifidobacterium breve TaxID=1685 RepID=UPI001F4C6D66|nr:hypothetical protein [Bifidobacterium breve]